LGRSWTPRLGQAPDVVHAIDWSREGRRALVVGSLAIVAVCVLVLTFPLWIVAWILAFPEGLSWPPTALELGFLLAAVLAWVLYSWLSMGRRGQLRAPVRAGVALSLGTLSALLGIVTLTAGSTVVGPALAVSHDRALLDLMRHSAARDDSLLFNRARNELSRRPSDRSRSVEAASRELRRISAGPASWSARLAAYVDANPRVSFGSENYLTDRRPPSLAWSGAPELALIDVLRARGATREELAWDTDPEVPLGLRLEIAQKWSSARTFPPAIVIAALGKACVETREHGAGVERFYVHSHGDCQAGVGSIFSRDLNAPTAEQAFASAYATVAAGHSLFLERALPQVSDELAVAMLRGVHAAWRRDATRAQAFARLQCSTLERLAALVCAAQRGPACRPEFAEKGWESLGFLVPCVAQLPPLNSPELSRFGGY